MSKWIEGDVVVFEQGKDPGMGQLRVVADLDKVQENENKRDISLRETAEVLFSKGRSTFIEEYNRKTKDEKRPVERQFKIAGLTNEGRPLLVVINPRDDGGVAKRVVTAWELSRKSAEVKKLLSEYPQLKEEVDNYKGSR